MLLLQSIWTVAWKSLLFLIVWAIPLALLIVPFQAQLSRIQKTNPPLAQLYIEAISAITIVLAAFFARNVH